LFVIRAINCNLIYYISSVIPNFLRSPPSPTRPHLPKMF
jgi:hypothetical protein